MSAERVTLDTNILFYAFDAHDPRKQEQAVRIIRAAAHGDCALTLQAVGEFYVAITRKAKMAPADARREVEALLNSFETIPATANAHRIAANEAANGRFGYWDAVLLASAAEAGCTLIFSEDVKDGARLGTITVRNPFGAKGLSAAARAALELE